MWLLRIRPTANTKGLRKNQLQIRTHGKHERGCAKISCRYGSREWWLDWAERMNRNLAGWVGKATRTKIGEEHQKAARSYAGGKTKTGKPGAWAGTRTAEHRRLVTQREGGSTMGWPADQICLFSTYRVSRSFSLYSFLFLFSFNLKCESENKIGVFLTVSSVFRPT
jgi:hypothetical protein